MAKFTVNSHHAYLNSEIIIKCDGFACIEDIDTGEKYDIRNELKIRLAAGRHILKTDEHIEEIHIEDAIKMGGSQIKNAFVFDDNPWIFVTTEDRIYISNRDTGDEKIEYNFTPDSIEQLTPYYFGKPCEYFLFQTKQDYSIYNVLKGQIIFSFKNHIFSNGHLVIFKSDNKVIVYEYLRDKKIAQFEGNYSFGRKFYFIKENKLYGLNLNSSYINHIDYVGILREEDILIGNYLLKLESDCSDKKKYLYYSLGNGEKGMTKTEIALPYYIESWEEQNTLYNQKLKTMYMQFKEDNRKILHKYPDITCSYFSIRINNILFKWESREQYIELIGEIVSYPAIHHKTPFIIKGKKGELLSFDNASIKCAPPHNNPEDEDKVTSSNNDYVLNKDERILAKSASGNYLITRERSNLYIRNIGNNSHKMILNSFFDTSNYINAYFTSDGKNVVLQISEKECQLLGIEDFKSTHFEIEGFSVSKKEGVNGYKPLISKIGNRKPIWRDPITLRRIKETEISKYIFTSPDSKYYAENQKKSIYYNRLTKKEISKEEYLELRQKYNWNAWSSEDEKKKKSTLRKQLQDIYGAEALFGHIYDYYHKLIGGEKENEELSTNQRIQINKLISFTIHEYLSTKENFTDLFVDINDYICYGVLNGECNHILIGRNVWYLNYVSFSYDSRFLAFGAKMKRDVWRETEEGIFVLYDIQYKKVVVRKDGFNLQAVWMTMFSKKGDVAYYDSHSNTYIAFADDNYEIENIVKGKSLLCFSPSGRYIALSDQKYIDFTHHPNSYWGHQPSGNVFIYEIDNLEVCIEQFNDLGDGIDGTTPKTRRAKTVASAAFSSDEKRMLVVGEDGVVVIRNLHLNNSQERT